VKYASSIILKVWMKEPSAASLELLYSPFGAKEKEAYKYSAPKNSRKFLLQD
jgi:hypothetical protein